ncbi:sterol desaturase family protein [Desulfurivibrio sp. C05AmB]|jgi:sterol desaturase/sphingolipid hydroxylase (fatty acid hydroxylase superfamily)|uniref:sterol desaturase family protein n=1 Tax=Desulfurivibrio sp. C05AmB TaxID=3374371 RepID=UPI00376F40DB
MFDWQYLETLKLPFYLAGLVGFLLLELRLSYRPPSVPKARRWLTNLPLALVNSGIYLLVFSGLIAATLFLVEDQGVGLLNAYPLPFWLQLLLGVVILDFFLWLWHLLNHEVPLLWRFHRVHHSDMNMDVSTASRFHLGEIMISGLIRLAVIYTFGLSLAAYLLFEILVSLSIQFHHSSLRVSPVFERFWVLLLVPPFFHRIHHSIRIRERNTNYGIIFSFWDRFFGTMLTKVEQDGIIIGIGSHRDFKRLGLWGLLTMPFTRATP